MTLTEYGPGKSRRIQLTGEHGRCSTVWTIVSSKRTADVYICPHMLGGKVKVSLHESGSWQVGFTQESATHRSSQDSRHWEIWQRGWELTSGIVRAWYLLIPDQELRVAVSDPKAYQLPPVGPKHAASIEVLIISDEFSTVNFNDDVHVVGRWLLAGGAESCLVVARRIPWTSEQQAWANAVRHHPQVQAGAILIPNKKEHRYYFHGHNEEGVRFGLELAGT